LLLVTGPSGTGKTTWCQSVVSFAREEGWSIAGLMSPPVMVDGRKAGIDLYDLQSDRRRRLATRTDSILAGREAMPPGGVTVGDWSFDPRTLRWGNDILANIANPDLLIVDELGPLEFRQQQGLQAAMRLIDAWRCNLICVAIRPSLIGAARMRWPWSHILVVGEDASPGVEDDD
jgi:nucleoside-triphosphatase